MANDLDLTLIASGVSNGQWSASNDGLTGLANALSDCVATDFSAGNVTLTSAQYRARMVTKPSGLAASRTLTLPAVKRPFIFHNSDTTYTVTLKSTNGSSPETATTIAVAPGEIFIGYTDGNSPGLFGAVVADAVGGTTDHPYDLPLSFSGTPTAGQLMGKLIVTRDVDLAANFSGSYGHVGTNPGATFDIDVKDDGSTIGTLSVSTGGVFTFTTTSGTAKTVAAGSRLEFYAPANSPAEATVANIAATLHGSVSL